MYTNIHVYSTAVFPRPPFKPGVLPPADLDVIRELEPRRALRNGDEKPQNWEPLWGPSQVLGSL